jgi:hypothetical protein
MNLRQSFVHAALVAGGFLYSLTGLSLLLTPNWFFNTIGTYPPFNRHYAGDLGSFLLPLGIVLLWASRHPAQHRGLIAFAAAGSLLHGLNHIYDDLILQTPDLDLFTPVSLLIFGIGSGLFHNGKIERSLSDLRLFLVALD